MEPRSYPWPSKTLRKGTRSCVECRRRKIRCYSEQGSRVCSPCNSRGSPCVDQKEANRVVGGGHGAKIQQQSFPDHSYPLANCTPEATSFADVQQRPANSPDLSDDVPEGGDVDRRIPFVSALNDAKLLPRDMSSLSVSTRTGCISTQLSITPADKAKSVCEALRSALPSYDTVISILSKNDTWWRSNRIKTHALSQTPFESLDVFAPRAYTSKLPGDVGTLVIAYAYSSGGRYDLYALVERLVISEFSYLATPEGMKCIVHLAKAHTDIGQPRKAWMLWRRAMTVAQLLGLYQVSTQPFSQHALFWEIYQGDRFISLFVGLPSGFNDIHFGDIDTCMITQSWPMALRVAVKICFIAGKIIDRNVSPKQPSFAEAIDLDEQMDTIAASMPDSWWAVPGDLAQASLDSDDLRARLVFHFWFFHLKIYVHLPFIGRSFSDNSYALSRNKCTNAARELLKRQDLLRKEVEGPCLYECKSMDFLAFAALVVLLICLSHSPPNLQWSAEDTGLIVTTKALFEREERRGCKISAQCRKTIELLSGPKTRVDRGVDEVRIPYFGTAVRRSRASSQTPSLASRNEDSVVGHYTNPPSPISGNTLTQPGLPWLEDRFSNEYQGLEQDAPLWDIGDVSGEDFSLWLDETMMDIDRDPGLFPEKPSM